MDVFTKSKRSRIMSAIKARGNAGTELRLVRILRQFKIAGWRRQLDMFGHPDFVFGKARLVVFVDGCFWHGCRRCRSLPATNRRFWSSKIQGNRKRDLAVTSKLRRDGWVVIRLWEHDIRRAPEKCIRRIRSGLAASTSSLQ
jgi:DNA mismatch endonuclease (patch repair protein)